MIPHYNKGIAIQEGDVGGHQRTKIKRQTDVDGKGQGIVTKEQTFVSDDDEDMYLADSSERGERERWGKFGCLSRSVFHFGE